MVEQTHERKKHVITELAIVGKDDEGKTVEKVPAKSVDHKTINKAKKASVLIQQSNGGLGCGAVKVVKQEAV